MYPFGITVIVQRSPSDRHGDRDYTDDHSIAGCAVAPRYSTEATDRRDTVVVGKNLYAPYDADIVATDRLVLPDGPYQVDGEPGEWLHPVTGRRAGTEVAIKKWGL